MLLTVLALAPALGLPGIKSEQMNEHPCSIPNGPDDFLESDSNGVPVLQRRGVQVTDAMIEEMRKEEVI